MASVLVADDDDLLVALLQVKLEARGYDVATACDGPTAVATARRLCPDILILDAMMPGFDGFTAAGKLRLDAATRDIPILMLTARKQRSDVEAAKRAGVCDYLVKPFALEELFKRVQRIVAKRREDRAQT